LLTAGEPCAGCGRREKSRKPIESREKASPTRGTSALLSSPSREADINSVRSFPRMRKNSGKKESSDRRYGSDGAFLGIFIPLAYFSQNRARCAFSHSPLLSLSLSLYFARAARVSRILLRGKSFPAGACSPAGRNAPFSFLRGSILTAMPGTFERQSY